MFSGLKRTSRSLSFRLTCWHAALLFIAAAGALGTVFLQLRQATIARERETIELRLGFLEALYSDDGVDSVTQLVARAEKGREAAFFVQVADSGNRTMFSSHSEGWKRFTDGRLEHEPIPPPGVTLWTSLPGPDGTLELAARQLESGKVLRVGRATSESRKVLNSYRRLALTSLAILIPVVILSGWLLGRRALAPLRVLTATVENIVETGNFSSRVPSRGTGDEIDELVVYFNVMLGRIEKLMTGLSESLDFAAHDLRTPLTRLRNSAQRALQTSSDRDVLTEALADCVEESDRVLVTVRRLIDLAAAEGGVAHFDRAPIDLERIANEAADLFREVAEARDVTIEVRAESGAIAFADHEALRRVVSNLLDNAIKYSQPGSTVDLVVRRGAAEVEVEVRDRGEGIASQDLPHIWSKLFRANRSDAPPGAGLGLSIVKAIVEAHGGRVGAQSSAGEGTVFTVHLPVA
jgi:signal transduction histidine kinase